MEFDPFNKAVTDNPFPYYAWLRENAPVKWIESMQLFAVTRYDDVNAVVKDAQTFSSAKMWQSLFGGFDPVPEVSPLIGNDPPMHTRLRKLGAKALSPARITNLRDRMAAITDELIDGIIEKHGQSGEFDLLWDFSALMPVSVIAEMLGIEKSMRTQFKHWVDDMLSAPLAASYDSKRLARMARHTKEFRAYFELIYEKRARDPSGDDIISWLISAEENGERLTRSEVLSMATLLLIGGAETTTNLLANTFAILKHEPEIYQRVRTNSALIPKLIDESLRFYAPVLSVFRHATKDTVLAGVTIPKGSFVAAILGSANRDELKFSNPDVMDIDRDTRGMMSFNQGPHFCLGSYLAQEEARCAIGKLLQRFAELEVVSDDVSWTASMTIRGVTELPVRYRVT